MATADGWSESRDPPQVSGVLLRVLADVALQHGVAPASLFPGPAAALIAHEPLDVRVPLSEYRSVLARAIELTGDEALGLRCGLRSNESAFDLMAPLVAHVPTLRHAIHETNRFVALVFDGAELQLTESLGVACLRGEFPRCDELTDRFHAELLAAGLIRMLRGFGAAPADVHAVRFAHFRPSAQRAYAEVFAGAERFCAGFTGVEFAAHLLDRPHLHFNPTLHTLVHAQAERRLAGLGQPAGLLTRLQRYLVHQPAAQVPSMNAAARKLGVSVRSLRRRLSEEGQSYRELTQQLQRERACAMLRDPELTLQAIAGTLGFADVAAFHRAFKRWTGRTACEYRARPYDAEV